MIKKLWHFALSGITALVVVGCQSSANSPQTPAGNLPAASAPATQQVQIYANHFFKVGVPANWQVLSTDGPDVPAFVTVSSKDHQALVTIRVSRSDLNTAELCQLAAKGFVANGADIVRGPEVSYGTCIIRSNHLGKPTTLWLRAYEDRTVYAINFTGPMDKVNEILGRLEGNDKMMRLLVMPL